MSGPLMELAKVHYIKIINIYKFIVITGILSFEWKKSTHFKIWSIFQKSVEATYDFQRQRRIVSTPFDTSRPAPNSPVNSRNDSDLSKACKLICASLIMSKKAIPLLYPPKRHTEVRRNLWETILLFNTTKAPSDCASRGNLPMRVCFCIIYS